MRYRLLGNTGLRVSEIGLGGWAIGGPTRLGRIPIGWSGVSDAESLRAIATALELGINFFDTADIYGLGHSEELIGKAIQGRRQEVVLATKVGSLVPARGESHKDFSRSHLRSAIDQSLRRLQTETIDLYQLHNPSLEVIRHGEAFDELQDLQRLGKIRFFGVSISRPEEGLELIRHGRGQVLQVLYNILNQAPAQALFPLAQANGVGIIARVPLASGLLTGKMTAQTVFDEEDNRRNYLTARRLSEALESIAAIRRMIQGAHLSMTAVALRFVLNAAAVSVAIPGVKNAEQVRENSAASGEALPEELVSEIKQRWGSFNFYLRHNIRI